MKHIRFEQGLIIYDFDSGLNSVDLFKAEGDKKVIQQLVSLYNQGKYCYVLDADCCSVLSQWFCILMLVCVFYRLHCIIA